MKFRCWTHLILISVSLAVSALDSSAAKLPAAWGKTMTNDPLSNPYLTEAAAPLENKDAETLRILKLSQTLGNGCAGEKINRKVGSAFKAAAGYSQITGKAFDDAAFLADYWFKYFNFRKLAHLCAGSQYLFGPNGQLVKGLLTGGKGQPKGAYDPANPFVILPRLDKSL